MDTSESKRIIGGVAYLYIIAKFSIFTLERIILFVMDLDSISRQEIALSNYLFILPWFIISVAILILLRKYVKNNGSTLSNIIKDQVVLKTVGLLLISMGVIDLLLNILQPITMFISLTALTEFNGSVENILSVILPSSIPSLGSLLQIILGIYILVKTRARYEKI